MAEEDEAAGRIEEESARVQGVSPSHFKNEHYTLANIYIPLFYYIARQWVWPGSKPAVVRSAAITHVTKLPFSAFI